MSRQPIVVGVDTSAEAAAAAELGARLAHADGSHMQLVHALRNPWAAPLLAGSPDVPQEFGAVLDQAAREQLGRSLGGRVPPALLREMIVQVGRPAEVITTIAREKLAGLIVLGGKHHSALGRWLGGSTSHNVVRATSVPVLVTPTVYASISLHVAVHFPESSMPP